MREMTLDEFQQALKDQDVPRERMAFVCPRCKTVQCAQDLIDAGVEDWEPYLGFSCVGRFTETKGCDWTLGGLFQIHELVVVTPDGERHPRFVPATREQAREEK